MKRLSKEDTFVIFFAICAVVVSIVGFIMIRSIVKKNQDAAKQINTSPIDVSYSDDTNEILGQPSKEPASYSEEMVNVCSISAAVRAGAGEKFEQIASSPINSSYLYLGEEKNEETIWYKVQLDDETEGYICETVSKKLPQMPLSGDEYLDKIAQKYGVMGMQVAVIKNGAISGTYQYGYAVCGKRKMTEDTAVRIASPSKVFLAMNAMRMRDTGIISFDSDIGDYWGFTIRNPKYRDEIITLRSIFSHVSSIPECSYKKDLAAQLKNSECFGDLCPNNSASWHYSNFAVGVAGSTMEMASGEQIFDYSRYYFLDPLDINASFDVGQMDSSRLAELYSSDYSVARTIEEQSSFKSSSALGENTVCFAGGLCISAKDYAKLVCILANDGEYNGKQYLSSDSVTLMEEKQLVACETASDAEFDQCLPLRHQSYIYGCDDLYYHTGNAYGVLALVSYDPKTCDGVVVITTGANASRDKYGIYAVCGEVTQYFYNI